MITFTAQFSTFLLSSDMIDQLIPPCGACRQYMEGGRFLHLFHRFVHLLPSLTPHLPFGWTFSCFCNHITQMQTMFTETVSLPHLVNVPFVFDQPVWDKLESVPDGSYLDRTLEDLLPVSFGPEDPFRPRMSQ